ncbi:uncharacterized protein [Argopecten irradians]|uniref:uncharacterized protein isoform X2 n=1 Tax=Argopecten irradians TaxID=31199 RepID=UPI003713B9C5
MFWMLPYLYIRFLCLGLSFVAVSLIPIEVVRFYEIFLWVSEFGFQMAEFPLLLNHMMHVNRTIKEKMKGNYMYFLVSKVLVICSALLWYTLTASLWVTISKEGSSEQQSLLSLVHVLCLTVHCIMLMSEKGILSDAAFSSLCSVALVYAMKSESTNALAVTHAMDIHTQHDKFWHYWSAFLQRDFRLKLVVRVCCIVYITYKITQNPWDKEESPVYGDQEFPMLGDNRIRNVKPPQSINQADKEEQRFWRSLFLMKFAVVFMFIGLSVNLFDVNRGNSVPGFNGNYSPWRVLRILAVNVFYLWRLSEE